MNPLSNSTLKTHQELDYPSFGILPGDLSPQITDYLCNGYNKWHISIPKEINALACVSTRWNLFADKIKNICQAEHQQIMEQEKISIQLQNRYFTAENLIDYIIENHPDLHVANISSPWLTKELIDKLLEHCLNIVHLTIRSNIKFELPLACSRLVSLTCCQTGITSLPSSMPEVSNLNCSRCSSLTTLPTDMPRLTHLNCMSSTSLTNLPWNAPMLTELYCSDTNITTLPYFMPFITYIDCSNCSSIKTLSLNAPLLTYLDCRYSINIQSLSLNTPLLIDFNCIGCNLLRTLPINLDLDKLQTCTLSHHLKKLRKQILFSQQNSI